ncbi:MAG TPA: hypothetical protein VKA27_17040, partial [Sunxiuqinia sp.]|nr:hypothetical protein [Sunxiuqinia sp.]
YASLQSTHRDSSNAFLQFISHDFYNKKHALGLGYVAGLIMDSESNLMSPFLSVMISKYIPRGNKKFLIPSFSFGFIQPMKSYSQFYVDRIAMSSGDVLPPGETLVRMTVMRGKVGALFSDYNGTIGFSAEAMRSYAKTQVYMNPDSTHYEVNDYRIMIHAEKIFDYYYRGLLSRDYLIRPRFVLDLGNKTTQLFTELSVQRKRFEAGIGYLPNLNTNNARFSINLGYDFNYFKLHYLGSILNKNGAFIKPMYNITLSVIFPELKRYGIPVPGLIRNL